MKLKTLLSICLLMVGLTTVSAKDYKYQSVKGDMMQARIYTLDNGLRVYLSVNKEQPRIQTYIAVKTGSRNDPAETTGLAHYLEHLMFKGTKQFGTTDAAAEKPYLDEIEAMYEKYRLMKDPAERKAMYHKIDSISQLAARYNIPNEYDKLMASIGAEGTNAYTSNDVTCYVEDIPSNEIENWAKIQSDRFQNMVIRGFHTELEAVYEEYNMGLTQDNRKVWETVFAMLFPNHPYGTQTTIGTQDHLKNPSIVNIKNYFNRYYCPNNVAICMSGDFDPDQVMAIVDKYFGQWKANPNLSYPTYAPVPELKHHKDSTIVGREAEQLTLAWKFDKAASFQNDTLEVISSMLSNGKAGLFDLDLNQQMKYLDGGAFNEGLAEYSMFGLIGLPKEGQSLEEIRSLLLGEMEKLKRGDFSDDLLPSVINNMKLQQYRQLEHNRSRADMFVNAFINGEKWEDVVGRLDRISGMTKQQIVDFANRHFGDNYAAVLKVRGEDKNEKKIEKPAITPIPSNRELQSQFVKEIINSKSEPIQPVFVDFNRDMTKTQTKRNLPMLYVKNNDNGIFNLIMRYEFGDEADKRLSFASEYIDYLGTDKMSAEQVKQAFYKLACSYGVNVSGKATSVSLSGLSENMGEALALLENVLANAKVDKQAYDNYVELIEKARQDSKLNQKSNWRALTQYATYGEYNPQLNTMSTRELRETNPQTLVDLLKGLSKYEHTLLYYGPISVDEVNNVVSKFHKTSKKLAKVPEGREYTRQQTTANEVYIAPYAAKNIYMMQFNNEGRMWSPEHEPVVELFNEYYGGGMNTVVFQELRETRGLAYSAGAYYTTPSDKKQPETVSTTIITQNDKMPDCVKTFNEIIDEMPQSQKAFDLAKQSLMKRIATQRTTKLGIINAYLTAQKLGIDYDINEKIYKTVPGLQLQDIVNFEKQVMAKKPYRYIILGDEKELDMNFLEKIGPIKRLSTEQIFGY